jgi:T-complex protein 1 subunit zeta
MSGIESLNPKAESAKQDVALEVTVSAAMGVHNVIKSNLGPKGTLKMLVSGAGDIKLTKDGCVLLHEMAFQNPIASMIGKMATAQDAQTGDGTTSNIIIIGELMKKAQDCINDGIHPRLVTEGYQLASKKALEILEKISIPSEDNREMLLSVARTALRTKLAPKLADKMTDIIVDAVMAIKQGDDEIDLHMIEMQEMQHKTDMETQLVKGLVMDHGARHPDMPKRLENCFILTGNVSLEYEKTEVNSSFFYKSAEERQTLVDNERKFIDDRVRKVIELSKKIKEKNPDAGFVLINQKGIDPISLNMLAHENIIGLRRAKRRNMERLMLACGGEAMNSFDDLDESCLGHAGLVYEHTLGEAKYTFVENCKNPQSCTILMKGPNRHTINQIKDAVRDGLRATKNVLDDKKVVPGAGAFELQLNKELLAYKAEVKGKVKFGVAAFADAMLAIPKILSTNAGLDCQDSIVKAQDAMQEHGKIFGIDLNTGEPVNPCDIGVYDNYCVKRQLLHNAPVLASQLLQIDTIMRAGMATVKPKAMND